MDKILLNKIAKRVTNRIENEIANKIASSFNEIQLNDKLATLKNKQSIKNFIYKQVDSLIKGYFHDDSWQQVHKVFDAIKNLGVDLVVSTEKDKGGDYYKDDEGKVAGKIWLLEITFKGVKDWKIEGYLNAMFAQHDDMNSKYDIAFVLN